MKKYFIRADKRFTLIRGPIRNQIDALNNIIRVTQYINVYPYEKIACQPAEADIVIWVDKMSRIFFNNNNQIHCLYYPFTIEENEILQFYCLRQKLDGRSLNIMLALLNQFDFMQKSIDNMLDCFCETIDEFSELNQTETDIHFYWNLFIHLVTQESGYLRYDHDETRATKFHPINHIDFFYSNANTFKVGLNTTISWQELKELVDVNDVCYGLHKPF